MKDLHGLLRWPVHHVAWKLMFGRQVLNLGLSNRGTCMNFKCFAVSGRLLFHFHRGCAIVDSWDWLVVLYYELVNTQLYGITFSYQLVVDSWIPSRELTYPLEKALLKMIFLFPRWDMLIPRRIPFFNHQVSKTSNTPLKTNMTLENSHFQ